jgi:hypothetical protein
MEGVRIQIRGVGGGDGKEKCEGCLVGDRMHSSLFIIHAGFR